MKKLWIPLVIVGVLVGAYLVANSVLDARVRTATAAMKAAGHPTTVEDLDPAFRAGSESTANVYKAAAALLTDEDVDRLKYLDTLGWREDPAGFLSFLKDKSRVYELVMQASTMPGADFGTNPRDGLGARIAPIMKQFSGFRFLLRLQARALAAQGKPDSALRVLEGATRLSHSFAEPLSIYHLVSLLGMDSVFSAAAQVAPKAGVPAVERLIAEFEKLDFKAAEYRAFEAEVVVFQVGARTGQTMSTEEMSGFPGFLYKVMLPARKYAQARHMETALEQLACVRKPWFEARTELARLDSALVRRDLLGRLAGVLAAKVGLFYERSERATAWRDVAVLGLRALVLKKQTGRLPAQIADIAPDGRLDRFSGQPYVYKVLPDGYMVYSFGLNGKDDGGGATDDIVFRVKL